VTTTTSDRPSADAPAAELTPEQAAQTMTSRRFIVLLAIVSVVGIVVSLATWCFLELVYQLDRELYTHLPNALGYKHGPPLWWYLPVLCVAGLVVALAITRLPGEGGHIPANGLKVGGQTLPIDLPGVLLAGLATIGSGLVLGPEAPLIALGGGGALFLMKLSRRDTPPQALLIIAAAGTFAALAFIFDAPLIAAVLLIEASGIGGARLPLVMLPGLLAAGLGTLVSIGMGSFTGLSTNAYALSLLQLPHFGRPDIAEFGWTIALAIAIALVARVIVLIGLSALRVVSHRLLLWLPAMGLVVAGLALAFHGVAGKDPSEVLFSGQEALPGLVAQAGAWSVSALLLLIAFKGIAYGLSMGSFRGGPTFPALFLGAAAGIAASRLPGFALTPAVAVGLGAATVAILRLPLSAVIIATFLTVNAGTGDEPLIIVGVVVAYLVTLALQKRQLTLHKPRAWATHSSSP
jgi:H+/Cl- antiporter ClcA